MEPERATLADLVRAAAERLAASLQLDPREARLEAQVLAAHALNVNRAWLIAHDRDVPPAAQAQAIAALIARRAGGEPVAQILGQREFYGRAFRVSADVLIPRPDTEILVEAALAHMPAAARLLDLGTGSGCIAISLALEAPQAEVWAVERSPAALAVAQDNAARLGARVRLLASDWYGALAGERFDLIVSNPPYIADSDPHLAQGDLRHEPRTALAAGSDGLDDLRVIVAGAPAHLIPGGWLLVEHGWEQGAACRALFAAQAFVDITTLRDLAGHERVTLGRRA